MTGMGAVTNALSNPTVDLAGLAPQSVDDEVRRLISIYGSEAVKEALDRRTPPAKRGRPKEQDWAELHRLFIEEDARAWLEGGDPFAGRTDYSIAKGYADAHPGQSHPATMKRIQRRLKENPYGRAWHTLVSAWEQSKTAYPYTAHLRTLEALAGMECWPIWEKMLEWARRDLENFMRQRGGPADSATMEEIEEGARPINALAAFAPLPARRGALFGLLGRYANDAGDAGDAGDAP